MRCGATDLDSGFAESQPLAQFLSHERVRVVRLVEQPLQLVKLLQCEVGTTASLLILLGVVGTIVVVMMMVVIVMISCILFPLVLFEH